MKEKRKVMVKCIEKEYIYVQNLVEILAKKYNINLLNDTKSQ